MKKKIWWLTYPYYDKDNDEWKTISEKLLIKRYNELMLEYKNLYFLNETRGEKLKRLQYPEFDYPFIFPCTKRLKEKLYEDMNYNLTKFTTDKFLNKCYTTILQPGTELEYKLKEYDEKFGLTKKNKLSDFKF